LDFDAPEEPLTPIRFRASDVRDTEYDSNHFDAVLAVSVIEHIGLENAQVNQTLQPDIDSDGDFESLREIKRILKPGGRLIMTIPFGIKEGLVLGNDTRCYSYDRLERINNLFQVDILEYYEYQYRTRPLIALEHKFQSQEKLNMLKQMGLETPSLHNLDPLADERLYGSVTWRRIPITDSRAVHQGHADGVVCGVWRKPKKNQ
jgi:SAM-dependent methyltransferase